MTDRAASKFGWPARAFLVGACVASIFARLYVMWITEGSNDIHTWESFANSIHRVGLIETYRVQVGFNHPPLMGLWCLAAGKIGGFQSRGFDFVFKLLPFFGDLLAAFLLWRERRRTSELASIALAAAFLWNPITFIITAYHGNTDSLLAALCLWSALLASRGRAFGAGVALGAALNVKLVAVLLVAPIACSARTPRDLLKLGLGFSICLLPFLYPLIEAREAIIDHVFKYNSVPGMWGLNLFFIESTGIKHVGNAFVGASETLTADARFVILTLIAWVSLSSRIVVGPRFDRTRELAAFGLCVPLVLGQGFGFQYLVWPMPLLFLLDSRRAFLTATCGGAFLVMVYIHFWDGRMPAFSNCSTWPPLGVALGLLVWASLVGWCYRTAAGSLTRRRRFSSV